MKVKRSIQQFAQRRQHLMAQLPPDSLAILIAASECQRNSDNYYPFRQNNDFYYLTGFNEPEAVALLSKRPEAQFVLFNRPSNLTAEIWTGKRAGQEGAVKEYGADQAFAIETLDEKMPDLLSGYRQVYFAIGSNPPFDERIFKWVKKLRHQVRAGVPAPNEFLNIEAILHEMRLHKSTDEIDLMRKAAQISAQAHCCAMRACRPGMMESELEAELMFEFIRHGARFPAYSPIVGSGANTCVLHYSDNNQQIRDGDLVLIDAGGEYDYYASDITRTFPANGRFTKEQQAIYELVLAAQMATIELIKPGISWEQVQTLPRKILTEGLIALGLLKGKLEDLLERKAYQQFYMHNIGHWLGLDTHDVGEYRLGKEWRKLEPGIVMTVEPGLYIRPADNVEKKWWNIGIRIEDDVLVTDKGYEVLSTGVPKTVKEIEAFVGKG
ncbi:MAG: Xaa-Pro aminopeptidase [Gammaproteobacteria bacterium]